MAEKAGEYCDLVMKGGVTSGIVYPNAVLELAGRYRFKNIGGTSAGAIVAAASAAAALGERRKQLGRIRRSSQAGFAGFKIIADGMIRKGFISGLFQPARGAGAAFWLAKGLTGMPGRPRLLLLLQGILRLAPVETAGTFLLLFLLGRLVDGGLGWAGIFSASAFAIAVGAVSAIFRLARVVRNNGFGLCPGLATPRIIGKPSIALTEWLHETLQTLSGQMAPLLFDHLWKAPRFDSEPDTERTITLALITTALSHHEPRSLPLEGSRFWFLREDFDRLFPKPVVDWMVNRDRAPVRMNGKIYYRLPEGGAMPVLVATRMSLSFPILISAVPLYEPDYRGRRTEPDLRSDRPPVRRPRGLLASAEALTTGGQNAPDPGVPFRCCWFSDGGISSNFPIHLFDAPLPRWPTFAINLVYQNSAEQKLPQKPELPAGNNKGWQRRYNDFESSSSVRSVAGFLFAIIGTMQNWRDLLQSRAPGHRDRIIHVPLRPTEGGLNLDMDQRSLCRIAAKGRWAGRILVNNFNFNNHFWVRWRNAASGLERFTIALAKGAATPPISHSYEAAHSRMWTGKPASGSYRFNASQQLEAQARLAVIVAQGAKWGTKPPLLTYRAPNPLPELRLTPTY